MSHEYPESFDKFSNADWEDYLGGPDDELTEAMVQSSYEDAQDYDPICDDDNNIIEEEVTSGTLEPAWQFDLDDEASKTFF